MLDIPEFHRTTAISLDAIGGLSLEVAKTRRGLNLAATASAWKLSDWQLYTLSNSDPPVWGASALTRRYGSAAPAHADDAKQSPIIEVLRLSLGNAEDFDKKSYRSLELIALGKAVPVSQTPGLWDQLAAPLIPGIDIRTEVRAPVFQTGALYATNGSWRVCNSGSRHMSNQSPDGPSKADAELEREIRAGRKFSLAEAIGRMAGPGMMKGVSPVSRKQQAEAAIQEYLGRHLADPAGMLPGILLRQVGECELLLDNLDLPLVALAGYVRRILGSEYLLKELVREADAEWGRAFGERPHFEQEGRPPDPDDPYTSASVHTALSELIGKLNGGAT